MPIRKRGRSVSVISVSNDREIPAAGAARLRELEQLADDRLSIDPNTGVSKVATSMKTAPRDSRIEDSRAGTAPDNTLRAISKTAPGDIYCPPRASGAGTSDRAADAVRGKLP
jgi:hypothetical protein